MTAVARRRVLAAVLLAALLMGEVVWGPGGCDPKHTAVTR